MTEKLNEIFIFLDANRTYNFELQNRYYLATISAYSEPNNKLISLLYNTANTQSQPKIDKLASFYKKIIEDKNCLNSMEAFIDKVYPNSSKSFDSLYRGMNDQKGWGKKTAALFTKNIFHLHNGQYSDKLKIWDDVPNKISEHDNFYLPVDAVIIAIFNRLNNKSNWNFDTINKTLRNIYNGQQIEIWDDLWFWGFITQNGSGKNRIFKWNENKYWILNETDKDIKQIEEIKNKTIEFLKIIDKK